MIMKVVMIFNKMIMDKSKLNINKVNTNRKNQVIKMNLKVFKKVILKINNKSKK